MFTMGRISAIDEGFIAGNFAIGLFMSICSVVISAFLGVPYFYFLGFISGFLSLMPYLGIGNGHAAADRGRLRR